MSSAPPSADAARRSKVTELVSQLKAGVIDDKQLFQELQKLQRDAAARKKAEGGAGGIGRGGGPAAPAPPSAASGPAAMPLPPPPPTTTSTEQLSAEQAQLKAFLSQRQQERATEPSAMPQTTYSASPPPQPRPPPPGASTAQPPPPPQTGGGAYNKAAAARVQQVQQAQAQQHRPPPQRSQSAPRGRTQGPVPGASYGGPAHEVSFAQANARGLGQGTAQPEGRARSQSGQSFTSQGSQGSQYSAPRYAQATHTNMSRGDYNGAQQYRRPMSPKPGGNRERSQSEASGGPNPSPARQARPTTDARYDEDDECTNIGTFKPKIKPLPSHYGRGKEQDGSVADRTHSWRKEKNQQADARRNATVSKELDGCTFQPQINKSSRRAMTISRYGDERTATDRLYGHGEMSREQLEQYRESLKAIEHEEFSKQNTFKPKTNTARKPAQPRYMDIKSDGKSKANLQRGRSSSAPPGRAHHTAAISKESAEQTISDREARELTFKPKTNNLKRGMGAARAYVQENVYDRLSRVPTPSEMGDDDRSVASFDGGASMSMQRGGYTPRGGGGSVGGGAANVMDMAEFMSAMQGGINTNDRSFGGHDMRRSFDSMSSVMGGSVDGRGAGSQRDGDGENKSKVFNQFINRQEIKQVQRQKKIEKLKENTAPSFKPELCNKSMEMTKRNNQANFLERVEADALKKDRSKLRSSSTHGQDPECTFKPELTSKAAAAKPRSCAAMSRDSLKKETKRRLLKFKMEQEELSQLTFKPELTNNEVARKAKSRIRISSDPDTYLQRLKRETKLREDKRSQMLKDRDDEEDKACTFAPKTSACPAMTKRIAGSWRLRKRPQEYDQEMSEARWKY